MIRCAAAALAASFAMAAPAPRQLAVVNAAVQQYEDGPPLPASHVFLAGETAFASLQVAGYQVSDKDRILLSYQIEARDPSDLLLAPPVAGKLDTELAEEDKNWMPKVRYNVLIPPLAGSGAYKFRIHIRDELAGTETSKEIPFRVEGRAVEPSDTLVVRNFRFLRGEEDAAPLSPAAYRPGDAVWARFEITGYKLGPKNAYHVEYGVSVLRPTGEALYSEPNAASEQEESFYPKRYVPGILSLKLDSDIAKGDYVIVVTARDRLGNQQSESRYSFRVE